MKFKSFLLAAAAMLFAVACNETPEAPVDPEAQVAVMPLEVSYVANGGENAVSVVAKGAWTATPSAEWITVSPASGEAGTVSVKVTAAKNEVTEAREGVVTFAVGTEKAELKVKQAAGVAAGSEVWGIAGSHQGDTNETQWKPANAPEMGFADGYYYQKGMELKAGHEFKFVKDHDWAVNRGYSGSKPMTANYFYAVEHNGQNIKILADGTYDVYLNEEATVFYLMEAGKLPAEAKDSSELTEAEVPEADKGWRVVGNHNGWNKDGEDVNMTLSNGLWAATGVTLDKTGDSGLAEFKFVQNRDWSKTVGVDNDAELAVNCFYAAGGSNIKVATGTYDLYLSEDATKFYVMEVGVAPSEAKDGAAGAGLGEYVYVEASEAYVSVWKDELYDEAETTVKLVGDEYEVVVIVNTDNILNLPDEDYGFTFETGIISAKIQDANTGDEIEKCVSGNIAIGEMVDGNFWVMGILVTESGSEVEFGYDGAIEGLGGGAVGGEVKEFVIASGKATLNKDYEGGTVWTLQLKSATGEIAVMDIDVMAEQDFLGTGYFPIIQQGLSRTPGVIFGVSYYVNTQTLEQYYFYPTAEDQMLVINSSYDGTNAESDKNMIAGELGLFDLANEVEAGAMRFVCNEPIALYTEGGNEGGETEGPAVVEFHIDADTGCPGECYNALNLAQQMMMPGHQFMFKTEGGDMATMTFFDFDQLENLSNYYYISGPMSEGGKFYPIMSEPMGNCLCVASSEYALFYIGGKAYYPVMPETEKDANGRPYGVQVMTMMPETDMNLLTFYIPAEDEQRNKVVIDGHILCAFGYTGGGNPSVELRMDLFGFKTFTAVLEGDKATLTSSSNNGVLTFELTNWGEGPFASEDGVVYYADDNLMNATFTQDDGLDYGEYKLSAGRMVLCTTEEPNVYTMVFSYRDPLKFTGSNRDYFIGSENYSEYTVTIEGLSAPATEGASVTSVNVTPYEGPNFCIVASNGEMTVSLDVYDSAFATPNVVPAGTYNVVDNYNTFAMAIHPGTSGCLGMMGSYFVSADETEELGVITSGTMEVVKNGDDYTITFDLKGDGMSFSGVYTGAL